MCWGIEDDCLLSATSIVAVLIVFGNLWPICIRDLTPPLRKNLIVGEVLKFEKYIFRLLDYSDPFSRSIHIYTHMYIFITPMGEECICVRLLCVSSKKKHSET